MAFVQIIDFRTSDIDGIKKSGEEWEAATEGKRTVRRQIVGRDRPTSTLALAARRTSSPTGTPTS